MSAQDADVSGRASLGEIRRIRDLREVLAEQVDDEVDPPEFRTVPQKPLELRPESRPLPIPPAPGEPVPVAPIQPRLEGLGIRSTPRPGPADLERFNRYVDRQIDPENVLDLIVGRPRIMVFKTTPFRVQIGDEKVATYTMVTEREFSVVGNALGTTVLNFWFSNPADPQKQEVLSYLLRIIPDPETGQRQLEVLKALEGELNRAFPNSVVRLTYVGQEVIVRGQAKDIEEASQILRIVGNNIPGQPPEYDVDVFQQNPTLSGGGINVPPARLGVFGNVSQVNALGGVRNALGGIGTTGVNPTTVNRRVVNLLRVAGVHQVMLKVTVAEVNRSAARAIGANLAVGAGNTSSFFSFSPVTGIPIPTGAVQGGRFSINRGDFELAITALKTLNLARSLAEPELTTLNGQPATLQVGGSFPVPNTESFPDTGIVVQNVEYLPLGVMLTFVPVVTDTDRVRLSVQAAVTTRSDATVAINGADVPSNLDSRNFTTTVELRDGQTLAVGGLLNTNLAAGSRRVPFHGDVPIWGRLFREDTSSYDEQELLILVTPYLVAAFPEAEKPAIPGSDYFEPDDIEFYILGRLEGCIAEDYRTPVRSDIFRMKEFRKVQQKLIIGASGHSDGRF